MKQLVCEMCGSADLVKQDGVFVCQSCGCKYSVEEAKKMMFDGTMEVSGTVKVDDSSKIDNYLEISENAYNGGNGQSAYDYANKALEIDPKNVKAWLAKMHSLEFMGTLGDLRLPEVVEAGKNAIAFSSKDQKDDVSRNVYAYEALRALNLLKLATEKMSEVEDAKNLYSQNCAWNFITAPKNTYNADSKIVSIYENVANEALALLKLIPDGALIDFPEVARLVGECAKQYQYETDALTERYKIYNMELNYSAKSIRAENKNEIERRVNNATNNSTLKKAREQEKRNKEYWEEHKEEEQQYKTRLSEISAELEPLKKEFASYEPRIAEIKGCLYKTGLCEEQLAALKKQKIELMTKLNCLGIFSGKQKKQLQEKIDDLQSQIDSQEAFVRAEKKEIQEEVSARISAIEDERRPIRLQITQLENEKRKIEGELSKPR